MRLYLLRHARAEPGNIRESDALRALTVDGCRDASSVGEWLGRRPEPPTHVLCSSARRAVETMESVVSQLPTPPTVRISDEPYLASAWRLFELARETPDATHSLLLVGHNPGMAELAAKLSARGDRAARESVSRRFLPATLAEIELRGESWADLDLEAGTLVSHFVA